MFKIKPKSRSFIGIDIQHTALKIVRLGMSGPGFCVERRAVVALPEGVIVDGKVKQQEALIAMIASRVKKWGLRGMEAAMTLPTSSVYMRRLQVPLGLSDADIQAEIMSQVQRDYPGMTYELCMDYCLMAHDEPGYMDILFVVAKQEAVSQYVDAVQAAGLVLKIIDIDIFALHRFHRQLTGRLSSSTDYHAVLLLDECAGYFTLYKGDDFMFQQRWNFVDVACICEVLKNQIERCLTLMPIDEKLVLNLYCSREKSEQLAGHFLGYSRLAVLPRKVSELMDKTASMDEELDSDAIVNYAIPLGVAMRDIPQW